jgi:hypothetical protein
VGQYSFKKFVARLLIDAREYYNEVQSQYNPAAVGGMAETIVVKD